MPALLALSVARELARPWRDRSGSLASRWVWCNALGFSEPLACTTALWERALL